MMTKDKESRKNSERTRKITLLKSEKSEQKIKTKRSIVRLNRSDILKAAVEELERVQVESCPEQDDIHNGINVAQLGFAACAAETFAFLKQQGIREDDPVYVTIKRALTGRFNSVSV